MRVALVTPYDAADADRMSGMGHGIAAALERQGADVIRIGPLTRQLHPVNLSRHAWERFVRRRNDHPQRDPGFLRHYARQVAAALARTPVDVVVGAGGMGIAHLDTDRPIVLWTDCTFAGLEDAYPKYSRLSARTRRDGHAMERAVFGRITRAILPSAWATESAVRAYGFPADRIAEIPWGPQIGGDLDPAAFAASIDARPANRVRLVFVGYDWHRKGGDTLLEIGRRLESRGRTVEIHLIGIEPRRDLPAFVTAHGRISKRTDAGTVRFRQIVGASHFMVIPTRAEAFGIAFTEAAAAGVPSIAPRTGGTPAAIRDGVSGFLVEPGAGADAFVQHIERLMDDRAAYAALARSAAEDARTRTHWDVIGRRAMDVLRAAIAEGSPPSPPRGK